MKITFPADFLEEKKFDFNNQFGNFLIGDNNTWHGGIHIEGKDTPIKAIADGRIIAYRFEEKYKELVKNEGTDTQSVCKYSNCFMIIQHDFELVKHVVNNKGKENETTEKKTENVTFYSLYNHLLPINAYKQKNTPKNVKLPPFLAKKEYQTGKDQKVKGLGVYQFEQNEQTKKFKKLKDTEVVLPVNTEFILDDDSKKENTIVISYKRNGKTKTSTYKKLAPFKDLNGENCTDYYANVNSGISTKLTKTNYKATFKKDTSKIEGIPVYNNPSPNAPIIKVLESNQPLQTEGTEKNGFIAIKGTNEFVNLKHLTTVHTLDESKFKKNKIVACDIPVKATQLLGHTGLKQKKAEEDYYVCHHEIFMAPDNEDTIKKFLNNTFDIYSEEEKPLEKKQYYKLPEDVTIYKALKAPNNPTIKAKTPVKVIARNDKFCKVKMLATVERTVEKGALSVNKEKSKGKKIVYDIVNFDYISKIFDGTISKKDTLIYMEDVKNTLVKVRYESKEKPWEYDFWIPFSDLSKNYEFTVESNPTKVYKSVRKEESVTSYVINAIKLVEADNTRVSVSNFIPNDEVDQPKNEIKEVGRKNVTKKTYQAEKEKELLKFVPHQLLVDVGATYVKSANSNQKKRGINTGYYPVTASKVDSFTKLNTIFEGKLNKAAMSPLFYTQPGLKCNAEGKSGTTHRRVTHVYKETTEKNIVPNIIHENEHVIQAILPVEVYKKFEISETNYKILPVDNTGKDPKVHEDVDTLFAFFKNKLPNVSGFELKWKGACNEKGDKIKATNKDATHRIVEFNIAEFNEKQEVQNHILDRGYTPKVNDEVGLIKDVTDIWMSRPDNKKDVDFTLQKPTVVKLTKEKDIIIGEEHGDFHYRQVETHNLYLGNDNENAQTGWVKIEEFEDEKFFSPYNWEQFGFNILDGGDEYIYEIKDTLDYTKTKSEFIKKIWENFNIDNDHLINADEVRFAMGVNEVLYEMSRVVAKHKSEWSYDYNQIKGDVETFYNAQINFAKQNKREQEVIDEMENQKQTYLSSLQTQVTDLMFWNDTAGKPYQPDAPEPKKEKKNNRNMMGDVSEDDLKELGIPVAVTTDTTATLPKPVETKPAETKNDTPTKPERIFPASPEVFHFHPMAFINQMKLMFEQHKGECYCNRDFTTEEFKNIFTRIRKSEKFGNDILDHNNCTISSEDKTFERLTEELNKTTNKYGINQCVQKMHFIAQLYWESARFTTGLEFASGSGYNPGQHGDAENMGNTLIGDGPKYKGRGFMQLTWRNSQIKYLKYAAKNTEGDLKGKTDIQLELRSNNYEEYISDDLGYAMDSAGWFWSNYKKAGNKHSEIKKKSLNEIALFGDKYINYISTLVNGGGNGKSERRKYYSLLRNIFKYDFVCINNENRQDIESSDLAPWVKFAYQEFVEYQGLNETESPLKEKIVQYHKPGRKSGDHSISWCASFVNWCFVQAGYLNINSGSNWYAFDWAPEGNTKASDKEVTGLTGWKEGEECEAFVGAIVVLNYSHCAIIVGKNTSLGKYVYIGGNQGNGTVSGEQQIKYGTVTIGNEYAIMKPIKYNPKSYELPEMNQNADGSYASTH
ncbi:hypothetical protein D1818_13800 [Aquimarina sp. BL5]|uniref:hypothetical protein n=1 Tax=Aquimarina sp. BL5 TaxID=1714860 RepID=UPI000E50AE5D|nr:hypothetical protein [Aquimarina sp. BL5]AXT51865.1 hypothetical protein D1818_13800 [Aquimarina sp. BL5]RKN04929.1 hypothetical protein D7036_11490 [Aquimarina sp. BL5]